AAGNFGNMFGSRRTADFLSKSTWWLGGALLGLAIAINLFFLPGQSTSDQRNSIIQNAAQTQQAPTTPALPTTQEVPVNTEK
ncbi:MAG: preprotein translocase subunit SecG, partial [Melioribacteraceae bacterium]|nr:preprotein translocase subunit SecG [Melioribacteraceae bacterium]